MSPSRRRALALMVAASACAGPDAEESGAARQAEEQPAAAAVREPEITGYNPDILPWWREGRPVEYGGGKWRPVGQPLAEAPGGLRRVGDFEGMALFAPDTARPPYRHLFFPIGNGIWQALEPADSAAPAPTSQSPRSTGTGRSPE